MIARFVGRRRARALIAYREQQRLARLLTGTPVSTHADAAAARAQRRLVRWTLLADLVEPIEVRP